MTKRIDNLVIIEEEPEQQCDDCGKIAELRPYGPNGSKICFECGQKDEAGTIRRMQEVLYYGAKKS